MSYRTMHLARRGRGWKLLPVGLGLLMGGCLIDPDNPCRENESYDEETLLCVCPENHAATVGGCVECEDHEVVGASGCECEEGYAREASGEPCEEVEPAPPGGGLLSAEGNGDACTSDAECTGPDATTCDPFLMACTITGCQLDANNCPEGFVCCDPSAFVPDAPTVCIEDACPF